MILQYVNSKGQIVDFTQFQTKIYKGNFHTSAWNFETIEQQFGVSIANVKKDPLILDMTVAIQGFSKEETLNNMFDIFETDIFNNTLGKLYWNDYYLNCFISSNSTEPSSTFFGAETTLQIYAPYPFWIKEIKKDFFGNVNEVTNTGLNYPYNYLYNYTPDPIGIAYWYVDHFASSNFNIIIYGPVVNPRVLINGYPYEVFVTLQENEYLIIDNTNNQNTITQYRNNGTTLNLFDNRGGKTTGQSIFQPIPSGYLTLNWSGSFDFTIKLFIERGIPKW